MKKILCFCFAVLAIISCKDDDENDPLEGTWVRSTEVYSDCDEDWANGTITYDDNGCFEDRCLTYHLKDGTATITEIDDGITETNVYTYTVDGSMITLTNGSTEAKATFAVNKNTSR